MIRFYVRNSSKELFRIYTYNFYKEIKIKSIILLALSKTSSILYLS